MRCAGVRLMPRKNDGGGGQHNKVAHELLISKGGRHASLFVIYLYLDT